MRILTVIVLFCFISLQFKNGHAQITDYSDRIYSEYIKTIRLYPLMDIPEQQLLPPAAPINREFSLLLEFDDVFAEYERYYVKFIHCNADWSPSTLFAMDYLSSYNEFIIEDYDFSFDTKVPYIHYRFIIPPVKVPGNYVLVVYRESEENLMFSKRFIIYDKKVALKGEFESVGLGTLTRMTQEIQFSLGYQYGDLYDPRRNVKVAIKQNQRWDNAIYNLKPTRVREDIKVMDFNHFNLENQFAGGNQFRYFDLLSLRYYGRNVDKVDLHAEVVVATLEKDKPRTGRAYGDYEDDNGKYRITHPLESDYVYIEFFLESKQIPGDVYVAGELSNWKLSDEYKMEYVEGREGYYRAILLKQGHYNFQYLVEAPSLAPNHIEGDHFETENEYEILVYYFSFELNTDILVGYFNLRRNPRF